MAQKECEISGPDREKEVRLHASGISEWVLLKGLHHAAINGRQSCILHHIFLDTTMPVLGHPELLKLKVWENRHNIHTI
jgi:hypothetical protein